jgi:transposase
MKTKRETYPSDVNDEEWDIIHIYFAPKGTGRPPKHARREFLNAIRYVLKYGVEWKALPHDFPPHKQVHRQFRKWVKSGFWADLNAIIRAKVRINEGRDAEPSAGIIDCQSVKSSSWTDPDIVGYDAGKQVKGIKRQFLVDVLGLLIGVFVFSAAISDAKSARHLFQSLPGPLPRLKYAFGDSAYGKEGFPEWLANGGPGYTVQFEVVESKLLSKEIKNQIKVAKRLAANDKNETPHTIDDLIVIIKNSCTDLTGWTEDDLKRGFKIVKQRWKVERTNAWMVKNRRLVRNYEVYANTHEAFCYLAMIFLMLKRLTKGP